MQYESQCLPKMAKISAGLISKSLPPSRFDNLQVFIRLLEELLPQVVIKTFRLLVT